MNRQLSFFADDNRSTGHIAGFTAVIRAAMNRAAAASPYSRQQIVDRMNRLAQGAGKRMTQGNAKSISLDTLEKWLNPESSHTPGLQAVDIFMRAVGSLEPLTAWLAEHNCEVMTPKAKVFHDFGKAKLAQKRAAETAQELEKKLKEALQ